MAGSTLLKECQFVGFPHSDFKAGMDVAIDASGLIQDVSSEISDDGFDTVIHVNRDWVSPGWIDLHTHFYHGVSNLGVLPEEIGPKTGVSILVDTGSAGYATFVGFRDYVLSQSSFPLFAFLNLGSIGLVQANGVSELDSLDKLDLDAMVDCIHRNPSWIKGVKIRASGVILRGWGVEIVKVARKVAREVGLPLMVHVGEPLPVLEDILPILDGGDIVTHCFHGKRYGLLENGQPISGSREAIDRGVLLDVGHGAASFSFDVAQRAIDLGYYPHTISTDIHQHNIDGPVWDLSLTASKLLHVGLPFRQTIEAISVNPAKSIGYNAKQENVKGQPARMTVFEAGSASFQAYDSYGNERTLDRILRPKYTINGAAVITADTRFPFADSE